MDPNAPSFTQPPPSGGGIKIPILFGAVLALVGSNVYMFIQMDKMKTEIGKTKESLLVEIASAKETSAVSAQTSQRRVEALKSDLASAQQRANSLAGQARVEAQNHADQLASRLRSEQEKASAALKTEIATVSTANEATNAKVGEVNTAVGAVKTDVENTKTELDKQIANLKRVQGDLGDQGSLIATNGKELQALRQLGERNYFEFKLPKAKTPVKVGDIQLLLKKTDPKKNRFTFEVMADDKTVEKRDRTINEPIQFLTSKARQPYEIVINNIGKDVVSGYLATPKVTNTR
jgi:chromosome segregation ATPase